jgi:heme/copper-type cytochrome/quinol oxidase subunit 3
LAHATAVLHEGEHEDTTTGLSHRKLLVWAFLGSDCMFFGSFIATYLVYQGKSKVGPFPEDVFSIPVTSVSTFVLLMSSMSMVLAYSALTRGSVKGFRIWLLSTVMLGMTFLAFQVFEFRDFANHELEFHCSEVDLGAGAIVADDHTLTGFQRGQLREQCEAGNEEAVVDHGLTPRTNLFGTTFFTLTGFHGAHVTLGVIWLLSLFFYSFKKGGATPQRGLDVDLAALYWHFVDVVWIVIFTVVYLFGVFPGI